MEENALWRLYHTLLAYYGPQHWWPAETPFEVIIGAILTQSTAWRNVEQAIQNLKRAGALSPAELAARPESELAALIRPAGYFNAKARKIKAFVHHLMTVHGGRLESLFDQDVPSLRRELLGLHGIGPETADCIILYAAGQPSFVIDAYTRRILERLGLISNARADYTALQALFTSHLPRDTALYQEYHALLVRHGKELCRRIPRCGNCPLAATCALGRAQHAIPPPADLPHPTPPLTPPRRQSPVR